MEILFASLLSVTTWALASGNWQLVIILAILVLLFGAKRLKTAGGDLGSAIRGFRSAMNEKTTDDEGNQGSR